MSALSLKPILPIPVGTTVNVSEPKHEDSNHTNEFTGTIDSISPYGFYIVKDMEDNFFSVEPDEIEVA